MGLRFITGGTMALFGTVLLIAGLGFINGPVFYLLPFAYPAGLQTFALIVGTSALALGLVVLASTRRHRRSAPLDPAR